jgi:hypothetical protein
MKTPEKPKTQKEQISMLWDAVFNHLFTAQHWQGVMLKFVLALLAVIIGLWAFGIVTGG